MSTSPIVKHISECFVKPKHQLEEHKKPIYLSPWDLAMLSVHYIQKGLLYTNNPSSQPIDTLLNQLKDALSITLVHFHLFAGQFETILSEEEGGRISSLVFIDPTKGPGARFIHASIDLSISDILSPTDVPHVVQSFFDHDRAVNHDGHHLSLLTIQVTELLDGIFIGCSLNHACGDGTSYWHFFNSFSEIFMNKLKSEVSTDPVIPEISKPPIFAKLFLDGTGPIIKLPFAHPDEFISRFESPLLRERIFHFSSESIRKLKSRANSDCGTDNTISSFQALSALMWRCITRARRLPADEKVICKLAFNNRGRLKPPLSDNFFGNCIHALPVSTMAGDLLQQSLGWTALKLNQVVNGYGDKDVHDWYTGWMRAPVVYQLGSFFGGFIVMMGSSPRFDMYGNEFGMGKPIAVLSGYAHKFDGKVTAYPGREGGGSVDLEICLWPDYMSALETDDEFKSVVS